MKSRHTKRRAFVLCLCLILSLALSVPAFADESISLTADTTYEETTLILSDTTLDLNGYTLSFSGAGSVFRVERGATLTIQDSSSEQTGSITGGNAVTTTVTLASNGAFGGGMMVDDRAYGGGVYVAAGGALAMTGGKITGNRAEQGGGVYLEPGAAMRVSGSASVTGNFSGADGDTASNVWLPVDGEGQQTAITVSGALDSRAVIGVTTGSVPAGSAGVAVTSGLKGNGAVSSFTSDAGYGVTRNNAGEAILSGHIHQFTYSASGSTITAVCTAADCDLEEKTTTLTLTAAGGVSDGETAFPASWNEDTWAGEVPVITYFSAAEAGATAGGEALEGAPAAAGWYYAEAKLENVKTEAGDGQTVAAVIAFTVKDKPLTVTAQPENLTLTYGQAAGSLSVSATAGNGYTLSYQWYSNTALSNEGGTAIGGATGASYTVPAGTGIGTYYYYCVVTSTDTETQAATSETTTAATVTVSGGSFTYLTPEGNRTVYAGGTVYMSALQAGDVILSGTTVYGDIADSSGNYWWFYDYQQNPITILNFGQGGSGTAVSDFKILSISGPNVNVFVGTKNIAFASASGSPFTFDGAEHFPTVTLDSTALAYGTDIAVVTGQAKTLDGGDYSSVIAGIGATYYGNLSLDWEITGDTRQAQTVTASDVELVYGGDSVSVSAATDGDGALSYAVTSGDAVTVDPATGTLTAVKAGTATVTVTAAGTTAYRKGVLDVTVTVSLPYQTWNNSQKKLADATLREANSAVAADMTAWNSGWYVVYGNVNVPNRITVTGDVSLILCDGATLTASGGIAVTEGNSLTVYGQSAGTGTLIATGASGTAGIGGGNAGTITINGGAVTATGGQYGAGIGGGDSGTGGTITINAGTVIATGVDHAAGIGGGPWKSAVQVTINGGIVTANGGSNGGAGIGGGNGGGGTGGAGGVITITGGTVTATGGDGGYWNNPGPGIGGGGTGGAGGTVTITGGTVTAISGNGPNSTGGIGGGVGSTDTGSVTLGATVTVLAGDDEESAVDVTGTFASSHAQKWARTDAAPSCTVTFKVVNGKWNDGTATDKTVTLTGNEGDTLKLAETDIPAVGGQPGTGYMAGSWDNVPTAGTPITEDTTYTYTYVMKQAQTLAFAQAAQTKTYGDAEFTVTADHSTGDGTVTYASSDTDVATVDNNGKVHILKAGSAAITATAAETDTYAQATDSYTLTVNKAAVTVTATDKSIKVGDTVPGLTAPVKDTDYTVTGLVGTDALTSVTLSYQKDGSAATPDNTKAGTYDIVPTATDATGNYTITTVKGMLTVSAKTAQTLAFAQAAQTKTYGDADFTVTADHSTGDGTVTYASSDTDVATVDNSGKVHILKAGSAAITATAAETDTYAQATDSYTLTVNTKTMTVSADHVTVTYDGSGHGITVTVTDPATGYTLRYGTEEGAYTSATSPTKVVPGTMIVYYQVTADNYTTYTGSAKVTVNEKQTQTVTASDVTAIYGDTGISVSATTNGNGALSYSVTTGDAVTVDELTGALTIVKAGTATITVTAAETATHARATKDVTVTVSKADAALSYQAGSVSKYPTDAAFTNPLTNPGNVSVLYASDNAAVAEVNAESGEVTIKGIGTANITASYAADGNHNPASASYILTVSAKPAQIIRAEDVTFTYGESGAVVIATVTNPATGGGNVYYISDDTAVVTVNRSSGTLTAVKAGTSTVTVTAEETANYAESHIKVNVTVNKATPDYTVPVGLTATYGDTLADVVLPATGSGSWSWADSTASVGNVGTNTFKANFTPADTTNYNTVSNIDVSVTVSVLAHSAPALTVTAQPATPYVTGSISSKSGETVPTDRLQVSTDDGETWTDVTALPYAAKPGTYQFKYAGDENNTESAATTILVEPVNVLEEVIILSDRPDANLYRDGETNTLTAVTNENIAGLTLDYTWYREGVDEAVSTEQTYALQAADVDKKLTVVVTDKTVSAAEPYTSVSTSTPVIVTVIPETWQVKGKVTIPTAQDATTYNNVPGASVELRQGNTVFASATTDADGNYSFASVPNGEYNIVVRDGEKTKTEYALLDSEDQTVNVVMPFYSVSSKLIVSGEAPAAVVAGFDEAVAEEGAAGQSVTLTMQIESAGDLTGTDDALLGDEEKEIKATQEKIKAANENAGADASANLDFLDLSVYKRTQKEGESALVEDVHQLSRVLEVLLPYTTANRLFNIFRYHGSAATAFNRLAARPTDNFTDGTFFVGEDFIALYASDFSTYAIGYTDTYTVTVSDGSGSGNYVAGATVTITANTAPSGKAFDKWTSDDDVTFASANSATTTFVMPAKDVTVTATYKTVSTPYTPSGGGGGTTASYTVSVNTSQNGTVKADKTNAASGSRVTLTVAPDQGYKLDTLTVTDSGGKTVTVTKNTDGTYSFTMPSGSVTVKATFVEEDAAPVPTEHPSYQECQHDATCPMNDFSDIDPTAWYHDGVHFVLDNGIMNGTGGGKFEPSATATRAMIVTMLWRMEGEPTADYAMTFADVESGAWYAGAIRWAASTGIVSGYSDAAFGPNDSITREQLATILYRYAQSKGQGFTGSWMFLLDYPDAADVSEWADEAMHWMVMNELIQGMDGKLNPKGEATRAQIATILMRYLTDTAEK